MADWQFLTEFHFIRPLWLLGILPAVLCLGVINKISGKVETGKRLSTRSIALPDAKRL